mmetsp:Transcript_13529/g.18331  ORF Transcript_13529/g.18331 Transcript_13529/m.18331 type:complete len:200 (+) Transcript_13529:1056-1655(+)
MGEKPFPLVSIFASPQAYLGWHPVQSPVLPSQLLDAESVSIVTVPVVWSCDLMRRYHIQWEFIPSSARRYPPLRSTPMVFKFPASMSAGASRVPVSSVASTRLVVDPAVGPSATHQCSARFQLVTLRKLGALAAWYRLEGSKLAPAATAVEDCTRKFRPLARCSYTASSLNRIRSASVQPKAPKSATYICDLAAAAKGA